MAGTKLVSLKRDADRRDFGVHFSDSGIPGIMDNFKSKPHRKVSTRRSAIAQTPSRQSDLHSTIRIGALHGRCGGIMQQATGEAAGR